MCLKPTGNEIEALPVLRTGLHLAGEQVEFDRLPVGLQTQNRFSGHTINLRDLNEEINTVTQRQNDVRTPLKKLDFAGWAVCRNNGPSWHIYTEHCLLPVPGRGGAKARANEMLTG